MDKMGFGKDRQFARKYGNVPVTAVINGREIAFKSKLEYRWAQYLEILRLAGEIKDWYYEFQTFEFPGAESGPDKYTPDFLVRNNDNTVEFYETKGAIVSGDMTKLKRMLGVAKVTLVFWIKPRKLSALRERHLKEWTKDVIWDAAKMLKNLPIDMN